ncbi:MAG: arylsulfatase, partial [Bradyrhizobium sp.]
MSDETKKKSPRNVSLTKAPDCALSRRNMLLGTSTLVTAAALTSSALAQAQKAASPTSSAPSGRRPNILVIFGDDIGQSNISAYTFGLMGYRTPN